MDPVLSALQQTSVWEGWLSAETRAKYFADISHRYQTLQRLLNWATLLTSSGALATLLGEWVPPTHGWIRPLLAASATALSLWSLVGQNQKRSTDCSDLQSRWGNLAIQYEALWEDMYSDDAPKRLQALREKDVELSKSSSALPNRSRLMEKWENHTILHRAPHVA
jgi:hypothetical protein